ncbi:hypothetical protein BH09SUM1_BH09SUM1_18270 [soil metagenome]
MRLTSIRREARRVAGLRSDPAGRGGAGRWLLLILIYVICVFLTAPFYFRKPPDPGKDGKLEKAPIVAQTDFDFIHDKTRGQWERERDLKYDRYWVYREGASVRTVDALNKVAGSAAQIDLDSADPAAIAETLAAANGRLPLENLPDAVVYVRMLRDPRFQDSMRSIIRDAYDQHLVVRQLLYYRGHLKADVAKIVTDNETPFRKQAEAQTRLLPYPPDSLEWDPIIAEHLYERFGRRAPIEEQIRAAGLILGAITEPSLEPDDTRSKKSFDEYPRGDLATHYSVGETLFGPEALNRTLSLEDMNLLRTHRSAMDRLNQKRLVGHMLFVLIVFVILSFYVRKFNRQARFSSYNVALIALPVLMGLCVEGFCILLAGGDAQFVGYLFPAGAIGMLGVLLLDVRMALLLVTWGCLLFGLQVDLSYRFMVVGLFGGYTAVAALYTIRKRWEVFVASILIGIVNAAVILITAFITRPSDALPLGAAGLGLTSGIGSFLVLAVLPIFERFGIVTDLQLLELTGLQHPLLRRLEEQAPGTWQHTLNVTKLAEAAASEIGVNYLLVRAGCYYHDIGKVTKPEYFTENQITSEDKMRHAELKPQMSSLVIKNHVKEGVELAHGETMPERIIDFIRQHHGTSVITFFYHKALEAQARGEMKEPVRIEDYRYPGPKPQTIEAAIVMLADTVEATATAKLSNRAVREDDIQQVVRTTVFEKFNDGQFDECNLTLRDLNVIRETFVAVLKSRFHTRIDYPKRISTTTAPKAPGTTGPVGPPSAVRKEAREAPAHPTVSMVPQEVPQEVRVIPPAAQA